MSHSLVSNKGTRRRHRLSVGPNVRSSITSLDKCFGGGQCQNKQHGDTMPKKARNMFLCSLQIDIKKARQARFSTAGYVCSTETKVVSHPAVRSQQS